MEGVDGICLSQQLSQVRLAAPLEIRARQSFLGSLNETEFPCGARSKNDASHSNGDAGTWLNGAGDGLTEVEGMDGENSQDYIGSQDFFCTPDFITPVEQQFTVDFDGNKENNYITRSPVSMTPVRSKRPRPDGISTLLSSALKESNGQDIVPLLEIPTLEDQEGLRLTEKKVDKSINAVYIAPNSRARLSSLRRRVQSPVCIRNPFLSADSDEGFASQGRSRSQAGQLGSLVGASGLSRYRSEFHELQEVGRGCFSRVYKALNRLDGCFYAIKRTHRQLRQDSERMQALAEVQALAAIGSHENIVRYYTSWFENDYLYIQLELCSCTLSEMRVAGTLSLEKSLIEAMRQIIQALVFVHSRGLAHLDTKPDNIYVVNGVYKLGDFGRATRLDGSCSIEEGDARYTPLEILNDDHSQLHKADIFSLGATMYELARGSPLPSSGTQFQALRQGRLALLPGFSLPFQLLIKEMMNPVPNLRPQSVDLLNHSIFRRNVAVRRADG